MYDRVRIIHADGRVAVLDKAFSQMVEMLKPLSREDKDRFWRNQGKVILPTGEDIWLVKEGV
jgi:hypothetical protein